MILPADMTEPVITLKDQYFDLRGLSVYSAMAVSTLRDYIKSGNLPAFKIKGKLLIRRSEFDRWIEKFRLNKIQDLDNVVTDILSGLKG
jgi:excisionase family DNA binding protein